MFTAGPTTIINSAFNQCAAVGDAGSGGAILVSGATLNMVDSSITFCAAARAGGAIETREAARVTVNRGVMSSNGALTAPGNGGALHMSGADQVLISGTQVNNNTAANEGGGLWNSATGILSVDNAFVNNNTADGDAADAGGGAIYSDGGTTTVRSSQLNAKHGVGRGGKWRRGSQQRRHL